MHIKAKISWNLSVILFIGDTKKREACSSLAASSTGYFCDRLGSVHFFQRYLVSQQLFY